MNVLEQHALPSDLVPQIVAEFESDGLDVWVYRGAEWLVRDDSAPHVEREAATVGFRPTVVGSFDGMGDAVAKVVGVGDDHELVARVETEARERFGDQVSAARSQSYYLDVTHPLANKGSVVRSLSERYGIPAEEIATLGDMPNDVLMFAHSGLGIAMGNADAQVQRAARRVTTSNDDDGFARAVDRFILAEGRTGRTPS
jgi:Cof subfamily protein (haloacid dehalogenase superfamily)